LLASLVAMILTVGAGAMSGPGGAWAASCQRTVVLSPQITARESGGVLIFGLYSAGCAAPGSVWYSVTPGTAAAGTDFTVATGQVRWAAGDGSSKAIGVVVKDDTLPEPALETLTVTLSQASADITVVDPTGQGRILDDDSTRGWAVDDNVCSSGPWLTSGNRPAGHAAVTPPDLDLKVPPICGLGGGAINAIPTGPFGGSLRWSTVDGTARAGVDYVAVTNQVVSVPAGADHASLAFRLLPRPAGTPRRWFYVRIDAVSPGAPVDPVAMVTIDPFPAAGPADSRR
jgi:hypothetical protein